MTIWSDERDRALNEFSLPFARAARIDFRSTKGAQLGAVQVERRNKRQALDSMRRAYERLRAEYLRIPGTTYQAWLDHGAHTEWEEVVAAAADDALWDRLVERGLAPAPELAAARRRAPDLDKHRRAQLVAIAHSEKPCLQQRRLRWYLDNGLLLTAEQPAPGDKRHPARTVRFTAAGIEALGEDARGPGPFPIALQQVGYVADKLKGAAR